MQSIITREQLWERFGQLDPFRQQSVVAFIDSLLNPKTPAGKRDKSRLLALSVWTDEDVARIRDTQDSWVRLSQPSCRRRQPTSVVKSQPD